MVEGEILIKDRYHGDHIGNKLFRRQTLSGAFALGAWGCLAPLWIVAFVLGCAWFVCGWMDSVDRSGPRRPLIVNLSPFGVGLTA